VPRGFSWAGYQTDDGNVWALRVDADYFEAPERGWFAVDPKSVPQFPRGWRARTAIGLDELGNTQRAVVASVDAPLWTGAVGQFVIEGTDEAPHVCTVIGRHQEFRLP
jgi:hypothetical protein